MTPHAGGGNHFGGGGGGGSTSLVITEQDFQQIKRVSAPNTAIPVLQTSDRAKLGVGGDDLVTIIYGLDPDDVPALLMKNGISAICMHTNLDAAPGGVNDTLCDILGIAAEGRESFAEGCGRIGTTMPTTVEALAKFCAATLHSGVKYVNGQKPVTCLAEVSGGGGSYLEEAIARGADCLVTGEAAHHIALLARQKGIGLVVAGHWGTEHAIADVLAVQLEKQFPALTVAHAEADADPYSYLL